jgi:hypothetical protein
MTCEVGCCSPPHIARLGKDPRAASCSRVPKGPGGNSAFLAEHFENRVGFWGISPSYALVGEPETNGVVERLFRTPKEQIIRGRFFQTIDEAREAVRDFAARYNAEWLIEKNSYLSPLDARGAGLATNLRRTAQCNLGNRGCYNGDVAARTTAATAAVVTASPTRSSNKHRIFIKRRDDLQHCKRLHRLK